MDRDLNGAVLFRVTHTTRPPHPDEEGNVFEIGIYSTREKADAAVKQVLDKPGFVDFPEGFEISEDRVGLTSWGEGYVSLPIDG